MGMCLPILEMSSETSLSKKQRSELIHINLSSKIYFHCLSGDIICFEIMFRFFCFRKKWVVA